MWRSAPCYGPALVEPVDLSFHWALKAEISRRGTQTESGSQVSSPAESLAVRWAWETTPVTGRHRQSAACGLEQFPTLQPQCFARSDADRARPQSHPVRCESHGS